MTKAPKVRTKHGPYNRLEFRTWLNMLSRCKNPKHISYPNYGARGIAVCEAWKRFDWDRPLNNLETKERE